MLYHKYNYFRVSVAVDATESPFPYICMHRPAKQGRAQAIFRREISPHVKQYCVNSYIQQCLQAGPFNSRRWPDAQAALRQPIGSSNANSYVTSFPQDVEGGAGRGGEHVVRDPPPKKKTRHGGRNEKSN